VHHAPLTDAELADFERDGYVVLGRVMDDDQVDALLDAERRHRPDRAFSLTGSDSRLLVREQLCDQSVAVRHFCLDGAHVPLVGQVLGPDVAFTHTQFITKLPGDDDDQSLIPLHQDDGYGTLDPPLDVTVWTALTDTDEHNGCLVVVPGSHEQGIVRHELSAANPALIEAPGEGAVALPLAAGEAVLFTGLTLHGSGPNLSDRERVGLHARYCHPSVRMLVQEGKPVLDDAHSWMVLGEAPTAGPPVVEQA
jgi:ectoine hydroxylase-related dioxygenase (phytanoyl-CoA dioxygenase family)